MRTDPRPFVDVRLQILAAGRLVLDAAGDSRVLRKVDSRNMNGATAPKCHG